jgi:hypothetical protein
VKDYQKTGLATPDALELAVPEHVSLVMAEVAADIVRACWLSRSAPGCR